MDQAGIDFEVIPSPAEEIHDEKLTPADLCEENAYLKAAAVAAEYSEAVVIGADTLVFLNGIPQGKPKSEKEAFNMLKKLSGNSYHVCTGVCIIHGDHVDKFHQLTEVVFKKLSDKEIIEYMKKVHVMDKAGAYAAQEHRERIIDEIRGEYTNVIGLPMNLLKEKLRKAA